MPGKSTGHVCISEFYSLALAIFDYESGLLNQIEFAGSTLKPLFNMRGSPAGPFPEAFGEGCHLPSPQRANETQHVFRSGNLGWEITVTLTDSDPVQSPSATIKRISLARKHTGRAGKTPGFN